MHYLAYSLKRYLVVVDNSWFFHLCCFMSTVFLCFIQELTNHNVTLSWDVATTLCKEQWENQWFTFSCVTFHLIARQLRRNRDNVHSYRHRHRLLQLRPKRWSQIPRSYWLQVTFFCFVCCYNASSYRTFCNLQLDFIRKLPSVSFHSVASKRV